MLLFGISHRSLSFQKCRVVDASTNSKPESWHCGYTYPAHAGHRRHWRGKEKKEIIPLQHTKVDEETQIVKREKNGMKLPYR